MIIYIFDRSDNNDKEYNNRKRIKIKAVHDQVYAVFKNRKRF